ncbi:MAG: acyl-CoA desaturase [Pseudomonadota bacterium]
MARGRMHGSGANARDARVKWALGQSLWVTAMVLLALVGGYLTISASALLVFLLTTALTLCFGHSLGMHRLLIHRSYETHQVTEYLLVWLGTLVGLAGPRGLLYTHDLRDWAQRQGRCHDFFAHRRGMLQDAWWQLHCRVELDRPPIFRLERRIHEDPIYRWLERTWMAQQLSPALLLYLGGGLPWVIWGVCVRVSVSMIGHWWVGYFAHNDGHRPRHLAGAAVQGTNLARWCGLITMGESWHNNHHAFPESARIGLEPTEWDPGWWCLRLMRACGLAWSLREFSPGDPVSPRSARPAGAVIPRGNRTLRSPAPGRAPG